MGEEARERERWETKKVVADEGGGGGGARRKAAEKLLSDDVLTSSDPIDAGIGPSFGKRRVSKASSYLFQKVQRITREGNFRVDRVTEVRLFPISCQSRID